jgi:ATP phosphoribosyltransferase
MGLCRRIVDLVETGSTLKANGLVELETIAQVSSRLVVNRTAWKQHPQMVDSWISRMRAAVRQAAE